MKIVTKIADMKAVVAEMKAKNLTIGFVPTMGFLHEGHLSLVRQARKDADRSVVSVFVNPLQFGPREDLRQYPRDIKRDQAMLDREGVDVLFAPEDGEIYPRGYKTTVEVAELQDKLCGRSRPGHFKGVTTVVLKLFNIVRPDVAFFGQKDAQQAVILQKMAEDLNLDVMIKILPTVREKDGLAMSSRNTYLSQRERRAALVLYKSLEEVRGMFEKGERRAASLVGRMKEIIGRETLARIDYVEVVDLEELNPVGLIVADVLVAAAVYMGKTRLIDNAILKMKGEKK